MEIHQSVWDDVYHDAIPVGGEGLHVTDVADIRITEQSS